MRMPVVAVVAVIGVVAIVVLAVFFGAARRRQAAQAAEARLVAVSGQQPLSQSPYSGVLDHPTKCVSCERALPPDLAWMGQKSKCFDCERDLIDRSGGDVRAAFDAHAVRYF
jgi:hypothetical protein